MIPNLSFPHQTKEAKTIDPPLDTILSRSPVSLGSLQPFIRSSTKLLVSASKVSQFSSAWWEIQCLHYQSNCYRTSWQVDICTLQVVKTPKFNMEPKNDGSKRNLLFQGDLFRFHVKLWEGIWQCVDGSTKSSSNRNRR